MPLPPAEERPLRARGARRRGPNQPTTAALIRTLREVGRDAAAPLVAIFDARAVAGERHLLSAWAHLGRSRGRAEARLRDRGAEFALYVAGDDQLPRALDKVGVTDRTEQFVVVAERTVDLDALLARFELDADPTAYPRPVDAAMMERLGITSIERATVPAPQWEGLVLERVALVDLSAPAGRSPREKH